MLLPLAQLALFIQTYILGRGVDSSQILTVTGHGKSEAAGTGYRQRWIQDQFAGGDYLNHPPKPKKIVVSADRDGIADEDAGCPDEFGYAEKEGCFNRNFVIVPFECAMVYKSLLGSYKVLTNSVVSILSGNLSFPTISIGRACV